MPINLDDLSGGGVGVGQAAMLNEGLADDVDSKGLRFLKSGNIETDTSKFDTTIFTGKANTNPVIQTTGFGASRIEGLASSGSVLVAVGQAILESSTDGVTWTTRTTTFSSSIQGVAFGVGLFVAVGVNGDIETSPDGTTWTSRISNTSNSLTGIKFANGVFAAFGLLGTLTTSPDGITWTVRTTNTTSTIAGFDHNGSIFVLIASAEFRTSTDLITWTTVAIGLGIVMTSLSQINGTFVATVGGSGQTRTSTDGASWASQVSAIPTQVIEDIHRDSTTLIGVGRSGTLIKSIDAISWTVETSGTANDLFAATTQGIISITAGNGSTLIKYDFNNFAGSSVPYSDNDGVQYVRIS